MKESKKSERSAYRLLRCSALLGVMATPFQVAEVKKLSRMLGRLASSHGQILVVLERLSKLSSRQSNQLRLLKWKADRISKPSRLNLANAPTALAAGGQLRRFGTFPRPSVKTWPASQPVLKQTRPSKSGKDVLRRSYKRMTPNVQSSGTRG